MAVAIFYDGQCPFCSRYVSLLRLRETVGTVRLVDLRKDESVRKSLFEQGFDLDQGMVAEIDGERFAGAEAVQRLSLLSTSSGAFNALNHRLMESPLFSRLLYPLLRAGRNASLLLLGRDSFQPVDPARQSFFAIFSLFWGMFAFLHFLAFAYQFNSSLYPTTYLIPVLGALLFFNPGSRRLFAVLIAVMFADAWLHMPVFSNHTMIKNVVLLAAFLSGIWHGLRGNRWEDFVADFAVVGRCALITMYIFGVFHKINSGFLDPQVSCAVVLWREMPLVLRFFDFPAIHWITIWGTLVVESLILCMLILPRWRHYGILLGMAFHVLLALSNYSMYTPFSMLSIALHSLFISPPAAQKITESETWKKMASALKHWPGRFLFGGWGALIFLMAWLNQYSSVALVWLIGILPLWWMLARYGRDAHAGETKGRHLLWTPRYAINLLSIAFFLNCLMPYMGLKTAQAVNMFANLRLEGGVSNHLIMSWTPGPFSYLEDLVSIEAASGSQKLVRMQKESLQAVYYDLLDTLERNPQARVTYVRQGVRFSDQSAATLKNEIETELHPRWVRNWFHFVPVNLNVPKPCALDH